MCGPKGPATVSNKAFYKADGTFDPKAAKKAYLDMMKAFGYPIYDVLKTDELWVCDFLQRDYAHLGMAGIFWINESNTYGGCGAKAYGGKFKEDRFGYLGHEIYLLPGQMIAEHQHMKTDKTAAKMEGWHVRHGWVYIYGEGTPTPGVEARIPPPHQKCAVARTEKILKPGECACLGKVCEKHWMRAGPQGAIVSEYATAHDMAGLRFSHPDVKL